MFYFKGDKDKHAFCRAEEPIDNYEDSSAAKHVINLLIYFVF